MNAQKGKKQIKKKNGYIKMRYNPNEYFKRHAKEEGYVSRAAFKLMEIDKRYDIIHPDQLVLDLGASPGSWTQYVYNKMNYKGKPSGRIVCVDKNPLHSDLESVKAVTYVNADVMSDSILEKIANLGYTRYDLVLSDLAPNTTGISEVDSSKSYELSLQASHIASYFLKQGGTFVCKIFESREIGEFYYDMKKKFHILITTRPSPSVNNRSREIFYIGKSYDNLLN